MAAQYNDYLKLLLALQKDMIELAGILEKKIEATQQFDLEALNDCIRKEQAVSLSLRGLESRRPILLAELGYNDATLRDMPRLCPQEHKAETSRIVEVVLKDYEILRSLQNRARAMLERHMYSVQTSLEGQGVVPNLDDNYRTAPADKPKKLRTDLKV